MVKVLYVYGDHLTLQAKKNLRSWVTHDFFRGTKEIYYSDILTRRAAESRAARFGFRDMAVGVLCIGAKRPRGALCRKTRGKYI